MARIRKQTEILLPAVSVLVVIGLIGLISILLRQFGILRHSAEQWQESQRSVILAGKVLQLMVDEETGVRGYVLSGDSIFLQPYKLAYTQLPEVMAEFEDSTKGLAAEAALVGKLKAQVRDIQAYYAQTVVLMKSDPSKARTAMEEEMEKVKMDSVRSTLSSIAQFASENVRTTSERFLLQQRNVLRIALVLSVLVIGMALTAISLALRFIKKSRHYNELIREARSFAESIVETVHHPLLVLDSSFKVTVANRSYLKMFQTLPESVIGRSLADLETGSWLNEELRERISGIIEQSAFWEELVVDLDIPVAGKRRHRIEVRKLFRPGNHTNAVLVSYEDITERDRMEQRLKDSNQQLSSFAYSVAHDLRAPLRAMQGFSIALVEDFGPQLPADAQDYAKRIVEASTRMDQLIRDLLDYSRLSIDEIRLVRLNLEEVVNDARHVLSRDIAASHAEVGVATPLPVVWGHKTTLILILSNLIGNALKFIEAGQIPQIRIYAEKRNAKCRLWVVDNGIGIAPQYHDKIFGVFERLHGVAEFPGTGIGLAIVKKGAERMGGTIGVESSPGQGSRFWVELNLHTETSQSPGVTLTSQS